MMYLLKSEWMWRILIALHYKAKPKEKKKGVGV